MGIFSGIGGEDTKEKLLRALAIASGDSRTAAVLSDSITKRRDDRQARKEEQAAKQQWKTAYLTMYPDASEAEAELAWGDVKGVGNAIASGNQSYTMGPGAERHNRYGVVARTPTAIEQEANFGANATPEQIAGLDITRPIQNSTAYGPQFVPRKRPPPHPGEVRNGYRFKGGDPADENNWEPVDNVGGQYLPIPRLGGY